MYCHRSPNMLNFIRKTKIKTIMQAKWVNSGHEAINRSVKEFNRCHASEICFTIEELMNSFGIFHVVSFARKECKEMIFIFFFNFNLLFPLNLSGLLHLLALFLTFITHNERPNMTRPRRIERVRFYYFIFDIFSEIIAITFRIALLINWIVLILMVFHQGGRIYLISLIFCEIYFWSFNWWLQYQVLDPLIITWICFSSDLQHVIVEPTFISVRR